MDTVRVGMDFSFGEEQEALRDLAAQILGELATADRVKQVERGEECFDRTLWSALADARLLAAALPEDHGGSGLGIVELCLLLEQQGRVVAPIPLWPTLVLGALPIAAFGSAQQKARWLPGVAGGEVVLSAALAEPGANDARAPHVTASRVDGAWQLHGAKPCVPAGHLAARVLVPARTAAGDIGVFLVDPAGPGVERSIVVTTSREVQAHLLLQGAPGEPLGEVGAGGRRALAWLLDHAVVALCAMQIGVCEAALRMAADYTSSRIQFGRPLSTFQGVAMRAADSYIDTEALRATTWLAAWRLSAGRDATREVMVAKWWAAESGHRVVHAAQHLHGGMGADVDYPVHRYFLWGKQIADTLGGASAQLARLGREIAASEG